MNNVLVQAATASKSRLTAGGSSSLHRDSSESQACRLVAIYEDQPARDRALGLVARLRRTFNGEVEFAESWWKISVLRVRTLGRMAAEEAAQADLILLSLGSVHELPQELIRFNKLWIGQRNGREGLLGVLGHRSADFDADQSTEYFAESARQAGLDYVASLAPTAALRPADPKSLGRARERLLQPLIDEYFTRSEGMAG